MNADSKRKSQRLSEFQNTTKQPIQILSSGIRCVYNLSDCSCALAGPNQRSIWFGLDFFGAFCIKAKRTESINQSVVFGLNFWFNPKDHKLFILFHILKPIRNNLKKIFFLITVIFPKHGACKMVLLYIFTFLLNRSFIIIRDKYFFLCVEKIGSFRGGIPIFFVTILINKAIF